MENVEIIKETVPAETLDLIVIEKTVGTLDTNIAELEKFIDKRLKDYDPKNFEGDADLAKKKRAELNTAKQKLTRSRIDLIKELMKPYNDFEERCKALEKKVDTASGYLDEIVKAKEQERKDKKRKLIESMWNAQNFDLFPVDKVFNPKWLNATFKESDIVAEIEAIIQRTYKDLKTIDSFSDIADVLKAHYLISLDIAETLSYGEELKKQNEIAQKEKAEREQREHEERIRQQKIETWDEQEQQEKDAPISDLAKMALSANGTELPKEERKEFVITVKAFDKELLDVKATLNAMGIEYSVQELIF
jgi:hypothetical protein